MTPGSSHSTRPTPAELPACDTCGQNRSVFLWSLRFDGHPGPFDLWRCRSCGQIWNWPQLPPQAIHDQYDGTYYVFSSPPAKRWSRATQLYLNHLYPLEQMKNTCRLLEIGCARGELMALARARGWDVQGIEISAEAAEAARNQFGLSVITGTLEEHADTMETSDLLIATDVIEHVTSPRRFMEHCRRVLKPNGIAIIETPNWDSLWRRFSGPAWLGLNRFHLHLFNGRSLATLMKRCGFTHCRPGTTTNFWYSLWGSRPELTRWARLLPASLCWRFNWGLNHLTPRSSATELATHPVDSLDQAIQRIETESAHATAWQPSPRLIGDNLVMRAEASSQNISNETESNNRKGSFHF